MTENDLYCNLGNKCINLNYTYPGKAKITNDCIKSD